MTPEYIAQLHRHVRQLEVFEAEVHKAFGLGLQLLRAAMAAKTKRQRWDLLQELDKLLTEHEAASRPGEPALRTDEIDKIEQLARAQALGVTAIRAQTDAVRVESATLGMSAAEAAAYRAVWEKVYETRRSGNALSEQNIRDLQSEAEKLRKLMDEADRARQLRSLFEGLTTSIVDGFMSGASAIDVMRNSLNNLAKTAANAAIKNALEGNFAMAAIDVVVAIGSKLATNLFDDSVEKEAQKAREAWAAMRDELCEFIVAAVAEVEKRPAPKRSERAAANDNAKQQARAA